MLQHIDGLRLIFVIGLVLCCCCSANAAVDATLTKKLDALLTTYADKGTTFAARVVELQTGRELYLHDADRAVAPASNAKLANVAAGLDRFGPDYQWRTYLALDGDDLWIIGTGDPSCGDKRLEEAHGQKRFAILDNWADALLKRGITHIKGKLIIDDGIFDDEHVSPTWPKSELTEEWSAPITGLSFNDNCISVVAFPDHLEVEPKSQTIKVIDKTRRTGEPAEPWIERAADSNTVTISGLITKKEELDGKAVIDPGLFFADALRTHLKSRNIQIDGDTERASRESANTKWQKLKESDDRDARIIAVHETAMKDILSRIDKQSQNLFADCLCKLQGRDWAKDHGRDVPGNWRDGSDAVHDFLRRMQIDDSKYVLVDGSGLSADNRVTTHLISDVLLKMLHHKHADVFRDSLSVCGVDGTLDDRMTDIRGQVHGKSGTIDGVKALSGYLTTRDNHLLVFSFIFNDIPQGLEHKCQDLFDNACRTMVQWPG